MAEDALDAAVVAEMAVIVPIRPRVVVDLCELHVAPVVALGADEKLASGLSAGPVARYFNSLCYVLGVQCSSGSTCFSQGIELADLNWQNTDYIIDQ